MPRDVRFLLRLRYGFSPVLPNRTTTNLGIRLQQKVTIWSHFSIMLTFHGNVFLFSCRFGFKTDGWRTSVRECRSGRSTSRRTRVSTPRTLRHWRRAIRTPPPPCRTPLLPRRWVTTRAWVYSAPPPPTPRTASPARWDPARGVTYSQAGWPVRLSAPAPSPTPAPPRRPPWGVSRAGCTHPGTTTRRLYRGPPTTHPPTPYWGPPPGVVLQPPGSPAAAISTTEAWPPPRYPLRTPSPTRTSPPPPSPPPPPPPSRQPNLVSFNLTKRNPKGPERFLQEQFSSIWGQWRKCALCGATHRPARTKKIVPPFVKKKTLNKAITHPHARNETILNCPRMYHTHTHHHFDSVLLFSNVSCRT